jgi:hypothetical protein
VVLTRDPLLLLANAVQVWYLPPATQKPAAPAGGAGHADCTKVHHQTEEHVQCIIFHICSGQAVTEEQSNPGSTHQKQSGNPKHGLMQACLNSVLLYQTAMTAARRRRRRLLLGETSDLDEVGDEDEVGCRGFVGLPRNGSASRAHVLSRCMVAGPAQERAAPALSRDMLKDFLWCEGTYGCAWLRSPDTAQVQQASRSMHGRGMLLPAAAEGRVEHRHATVSRSQITRPKPLQDPHSGLSPSAIEAAEDEAEDNNDGTASASAASAAMAEAADSALGGDGGFG